MKRYLLALATLLLLACPRLPAQRSEPALEEKGTYLGVLIGPVPEVVYDQLPDLPRGRGVVVSQVLPHSPADDAGLQRHDILLAYNQDQVRNCEHFAQLIRADQPDHKVKLELFRAGQKMTAEATLTLGPVLKVVQANQGIRDNAALPLGTTKPGGPPSVSLTAAPLEGGQWKVTLEYYQEGTGRLRTVTCEGTLEEIDAEVQKLPARLQGLANVALRRLRGQEPTVREPKVPANAGLHKPG